MGNCLGIGYSEYVPTRIAETNMPSIANRWFVAKLLPRATRGGGAVPITLIGRRIVEKVRFAAGVLISLAGALHLLVTSVEFSALHF